MLPDEVTSYLDELVMLYANYKYNKNCAEVYGASDKQDLYKKETEKAAKLILEKLKEKP